MDPQELDRRLRTITEHEALYRLGMQRSLAKPFPTCRIDGREVMQFFYAAISEEMTGVPFLVKKHSRYRAYPLHIHDWVELVYMYSGSSVQIVNDTRYTMHQGQVMLMAPGIVHTIEKLGTDDILIQIALGQDNLTHGFFNRISSTGIVSNFPKIAWRTSFSFRQRKAGGSTCLLQSSSVNGMTLLPFPTIC